MEILPGIGLGQIKYGMTKSDITMILGEPDRYEEIEYNSVTDDQALKLYFYKLQICLSFDQEDDYKLGTITILGRGHKLFNRDLYHLPKENVKILVAKSTSEIPKDEDWSTDENSLLECLDHDGLAILFWFKDGYLERLECSYFFESDGETAIWP